MPRGCGSGSMGSGARAGRGGGGGGRGWRHGFSATALSGWMRGLQNAASRRNARYRKRTARAQESSPGVAGRTRRRQSAAPRVDRFGKNRVTTTGRKGGVPKRRPFGEFGFFANYTFRGHCAKKTKVRHIYRGTRRPCSATGYARNAKESIIPITTIRPREPSGDELPFRPSRNKLG